MDIVANEEIESDHNERNLFDKSPEIVPVVFEDNLVDKQKRPQFYESDKD